MARADKLTEVLCLDHAPSSFNRHCNMMLMVNRNTTRHTPPSLIIELGHHHGVALARCEANMMSGGPGRAKKKNGPAQEQSLSLSRSRALARARACAVSLTAGQYRRFSLLVEHQ